MSLMVEYTNGDLAPVWAFTVRTNTAGRSAVVYLDDPEYDLGGVREVRITSSNENGTFTLFAGPALVEPRS